ncbi:hypothetical protein B0H13DRAFT_1915627 [Mycena leptocephala]|nr:hypothetical protein B0H13DRAFT_1915627 [Mycena leptocephala]
MPPFAPQHNDSDEEQRTSLRTAISSTALSGAFQSSRLRTRRLGASTIKSFANLVRAISKVVSAFDSVESLIAEDDRRRNLEDARTRGDEIHEEEEEPTAELVEPLSDLSNSQRQPLRVLSDINIGMEYNSFEAGQDAVYKLETSRGRIWRIGQTKKIPGFTKKGFGSFGGEYYLIPVTMNATPRVEFDIGGHMFTLERSHLPQAATRTIGSIKYYFGAVQPNSFLVSDGGHTMALT